MIEHNARGRNAHRDPLRLLRTFRVRRQVRRQLAFRGVVGGADVPFSWRIPRRTPRKRGCAANRARCSSNVSADVGVSPHPHKRRSVRRQVENPLIAFQPRRRLDPNPLGHAEGLGACLPMPRQRGTRKHRVFFGRPGNASWARWIVKVGVNADGGSSTSAKETTCRVPGFHKSPSKSRVPRRGRG